jgi:hypothetical protein
METTDNCIECTRCKSGHDYVDDEHHHWEYYFTTDGCQKNCSRHGYPYEMIVNRHECKCIPGYHRDEYGIC